MTIYWYCMTCKTDGVTTGTESGADAKHVKTTGHATYTTTNHNWVVRR